jgi:hypothetical protein
MHTFGKNWTRLDSGILVPDGCVFEKTEVSEQTYLAAKTKAQAIESVFTASGIKVDPACGLRRLIADATKLSDAWISNDVASLTKELLIRVLVATRVFDAVLFLKDVPNAKPYLAALQDGTLDLLSRERSKAKDTLWEIELQQKFVTHAVPARLQDPPDIVFELGAARFGVACKKLYSEAHVQNVLSKAVAQIEGIYKVGIVAINLDDLMPANKHMTVSTRSFFNDHMDQYLKEFLDRHDRHFRKYLSQARAVSVYISVTVPAAIADLRAGIYNATRGTYWNMPGLPEDKHTALHRLYGMLLRD